MVLLNPWKKLSLLEAKIVALENANNDIKSDQAQDSINNPVTGLGTFRDKSTYSQYDFMKPLGFSNYIELENMYGVSGLARRIVDSVPEDMMRAGVEVILKENNSSDILETLDEEEKKLQLHHKIQKALKLARIYGGSVLLLIIRDDILKEPLDIDSIGINDLQGIQVFDRMHCQAVGILDTDPTSDNFGKPLFYRLQTYNVEQDRYEGLANGEIHHTRIIRFDGAFLTQSQMMRNGFWGASILEVLLTAIMRYDKALAITNVMLDEATVDVIKSPAVNLAYESGGLQNFKKMLSRMGQSQKQKSVIRALLLGIDEEYEKKINSFVGVRDILESYIKDICAQSDIVEARLFGDSSRGLNSGEGDLRHYYDMVQSRRINELEPKYMLLYRIILRSLFGQDPKFTLRFPPLWQPSDLEKAQTEKARSDTDIAYLNSNAISTQDVQDRLKNNETYNISASSEKLAKVIDEKMLSGDENNDETQNNQKTQASNNNEDKESIEA